MTNSVGLIPFTRWIIRFEKEKSDKGIFSRWISGHDNFRHVDTKEVFIERFKKSGCSEFILDTFESIWNEFVMVSNARISMATVNGRGRKYRSRLD